MVSLASRATSDVGSGLFHPPALQGTGASPATIGAHSKDGLSMAKPGRNAMIETGNLPAMRRLEEGMDADDAIKRIPSRLGCDRDPSEASQAGWVPERYGDCAVACMSVCRPGPTAMVPCSNIRRR